jgi:hypothetical protein
VLGNCQSGALSLLIECICPTMKRLSLPAIHTLDKKKPEVVWSIVRDVDVVIHQPISDSFQEIGINALKLKFPNKLYISFPSIYFNGYFPNLIYLRKPAGGTLGGRLRDFHDSRIVEGAIFGQSIEEIKNQICKKIPVDKVLTDVNISLENLRKREIGLDVEVTSYIKKNVFKKRLFYVFNHPINDVLIYVAIRICDILKQNVTNERLQLGKNKPDYLAKTQAPLDYSIIQLLDSTVSNDLIYAIRDNSGHVQKWPLINFIETQVDLYRSITDLEKIYNFSLRRNEKLEG